MSSPPTSLPLRGFRVLDLTNVLAGPGAGTSADKRAAVLSALRKFQQEVEPISIEAAQDLMEFGALSASVTNRFPPEVLSLLPGNWVAEMATPTTPEAYGQLIAAELRRWAPVVKAGNIRAD